MARFNKCTHNFDNPVFTMKNGKHTWYLCRDCWRDITELMRIHIEQSQRWIELNRIELNPESTEEVMFSREDYDYLASLEHNENPHT